MVLGNLLLAQFGTVLAYWLDYGTIRNLTGEVRSSSWSNQAEHTLISLQVVWRFPIAFQNALAMITLVTLPFLPETPR
jgi:hypothetical protein